MGEVYSLMDEAIKTDYDLGRIELDNGKYEEAYRRFIKCYNENKRSLRFMEELAYCAHMTGRTAEALKYGRQIIMLYPANAVAYNNIGVIYSESGCEKEAYDFFKRAIAINPADECFIFNLAACCNSLKRFDESEPLLLKLFRKDEKSIYVIDALVFLYSATGNTRKLYRYLLQKEKVFPRDSEGFLETGLFLAKNKKFKKSLDHLQRALLLDRENPIIYFNLALAYVNLNEDKKALEIYFSAVIRDPNLAELFWTNGVIPDLRVEHTLKYEILNFAAENGDKKAAEALKNNSWI